MLLGQTQASKQEYNDLIVSSTGGRQRRTCTKLIKTSCERPGHTILPGRRNKRVDIFGIASGFL